MSKLTHYIFYFFGIGCCFLNTSCKIKSPPASHFIFKALKEERTGLHFNNALTPCADFNMFNYMYFYNGSGIGAGDFNNDGWIDVFFCANQGGNKIYLSEGNLHFKDVTVQAKIPEAKDWSTGVSVVDINNDGLLDIYICKVGKFELLNSRNQLLVCKGIKNGIPFYQDEARQYGLDFSGFSTQAAFFDYDMDGDLDMYLLNHSVHQSGSFAPRSHFINTYSALSGDRLFRNDGNHFTDLTKQSLINSSEIGYGLGIAISDINLDGWPDIYIGNDFHENDYLYINQKDGTFRDENSRRLMHTSKYSMGVDIADVNNDGYSEIISVDMLPEDPYILKRSLGDDDYDIFFDKISSGYSYQYSRNNLQNNTRNGIFSETGAYSGIAATDWSWAPLWMDFDNDGLKDLFISNGIPKRLNDMDYINFVYSREIRYKIQNNDMEDKDMSMIKKFPEIKIKNKFYSNTDELKFLDMEASVEDDQPTYSNGAVYADFDNDGDLDVVVNNINDPVLLYENKASKKENKNFVDIKLKGSENNTYAVGSKLALFVRDKIQLYENNPARGFMSSMVIPMHIGFGKAMIDSAFLIWPDNSFEKITIDTSNQYISFVYQKGLPQFDFRTITSFKANSTSPVVDIIRETKLTYLHKENAFNEFDREPLLPHMLSTEGPALAVADINQDGLEDVFIGASKSFHNAIYLQKPNGQFLKTIQPDLFKDSLFEDVDATWADVNNDGNVDLVIASGGNEYYGHDDHLLPRVYLNNGIANFSRVKNAFIGEYVTASCIVANDFNGDGFIDLFLGGRAVPWNYGEIPGSYLLQNDGTGKFMDVTKKFAMELAKIGMVTDAVWEDINKDGNMDLVVCCEWGGIYAFMNTKSGFIKKVLTNKRGWWNFILPVDVDNDGDMDLIAGNLGLNSLLKATPEQAVRLYFNDFDGNGQKEQAITYYIKNREIPFATKEELQKQIPSIKKKFIFAEDFAKASINDIFSEDKIKNSSILTADYFANSILINNGNGDFSLKELPWQAQLTSYRDAETVDANKDNLPDIILVGNYYANNIHIGRYDAGRGNLLLNKGSGGFNCENLNGLNLSGESRHIRKIKINNQTAYIIARNNDSLEVIQFSEGIK